MVPDSLPRPPSKAPEWYPLHTVGVLCGSGIHREETKRRAVATMLIRTGYACVAVI